MEAFAAGYFFSLVVCETRRYSMGCVKAGTFYTIEACEQAGEAVKDRYDRRIEFICAPSEPTND